jgi:uncharacterized protein (DUF305 family)
LSWTAFGPSVRGADPEDEMPPEASTPEAKALASTIIKVESEEVLQMRNWLRRHSPN